jgi:hypothetical protein
VAAGGREDKLGVRQPPSRPLEHYGCKDMLEAESASRLLIVLVIMTMQFGRINAFNEMCAGFKVK